MTTETPTVYMSPNGHPLLYMGPLPADPLLVVENYCKWYSLYVLYPDGRIVNAMELGEGAEALIADAWADHNFKPWIVRQLAETVGIEWHEESIDLLVGRYVTECEQLPQYCGTDPPRATSRLRGRKTYRTGQIAEICGASPQLVCKWIDSGKLKGTRLPGSAVRRVTRAALLDFMRQYGMDTSEIA